MKLMALPVEEADMNGQQDLFGEIHEDELVKMAQKVAAERGYATYRDYNDYIWERIRREKPEGADIGRTHEKILLEIVEKLEARVWVSPPLAAGEERRFYPPGTELDQTNYLKLIE